jgi:hypothetical protein
MSEIIMTPETEEYKTRIEKLSDEELEKEIAELIRLKDGLVQKHESRELIDKFSIARMERFFRNIEAEKVGKTWI